MSSGSPTTCVTTLSGASENALAGGARSRTVCIRCANPYVLDPGDSYSARAAIVRSGATRRRNMARCRVCLTEASGRFGSSCGAALAATGVTATTPLGAAVRTCVSSTPEQGRFPLKCGWPGRSPIPTSAAHRTSARGCLKEFGWAQRKFSTKTRSLPARS